MIHLQDRSILRDDNGNYSLKSVFVPRTMPLFSLFNDSQTTNRTQRNSLGPRRKARKVSAPGKGVCVRERGIYLGVGIGSVLSVGAFPRAPLELRRAGGLRLSSCLGRFGDVVFLVWLVWVVPGFGVVVVVVVTRRRRRYCRRRQRYASSMSSSSSLFSF